LACRHLIAFFKPGYGQTIDVATSDLAKVLHWKLEELNKDPQLRKIALQKVGKTGYTVRYRIAKDGLPLACGCIPILMPSVSRSMCSEKTIG
jgi:hypothetical protein